jgi:hypothetical protein
MAKITQCKTSGGRCFLLVALRTIVSTNARATLVYAPRASKWGGGLTIRGLEPLLTSTGAPRPGSGAGTGRASSIARAAGRPGGVLSQPRSRELAGGGLHRAGERGKTGAPGALLHCRAGRASWGLGAACTGQASGGRQEPQEPQVPCCTAGRAGPPRRPAPGGQGLSE